MHIVGPNINFLKICLDWFDHHLKQVNNGIMNEPKLRAYLQHYVGPTKADLTTIPGHWIAFDQWPVNCLENQSLVLHNGTLKQHAQNVVSGEYWEDINFVRGFGIDYCAWVEMTHSFGPASQTPCKDLGLLTFVGDELEEDVAIFGNPEFSCILKGEDSNISLGLIMVQLLIDAPDGESIMASLGTKNILDAEETSQFGGGRIVNIKLHALSQIVPKGFKISLRISSNFWPYVWCSQKPLKLKILTGGENKMCTPVLHLPVIQKHQQHHYSSEDFNCSNVIMGLDLPAIQEEPPKFTLKVDHSDTPKCHIRRILNDYGTISIPSNGCSISNCCREMCEIKEIGLGNAAVVESEHVTTIKFQHVNNGNGKQHVGDHRKIVTESEEMLPRNVTGDIQPPQSNAASEALQTKTQTGRSLSCDEYVEEISAKDGKFFKKDNLTIVKVCAKISLALGDHAFLFDSSLVAEDNGVVICDRNWHKEIQQI